jgi:transcriptional regulator with XRE-family HTH domain
MIQKEGEVCLLEELILANAERIRQEKGLTHQAMADALGMHKVALGDIFRQKRRMSVRNLERLSIALDVHPAVLLLEN